MLYSYKYKSNIHMSIYICNFLLLLPFINCFTVDKGVNFQF